MSSFASGKFALRATGQSLAREFGPKGVHVAHAIIDGVIDIPRTKEWPVNGGVEDGKINSDAVSDTILFAARKERHRPSVSSLRCCGWLEGLAADLVRGLDCGFLLVSPHPT